MKFEVRSLKFEVGLIGTFSGVARIPASQPTNHTETITYSSKDFTNRNGVEATFRPDRRGCKSQDPNQFERLRTSRPQHRDTIETCWHSDARTAGAQTRLSRTPRRPAMRRISRTNRRDLARLIAPAILALRRSCTSASSPRSMMARPLCRVSVRHLRRSNAAACARQEGRWPIRSATIAI